jgi:hypothetical protein
MEVCFCHNFAISASRAYVKLCLSSTLLDAAALTLALLLLLLLLSSSPFVVLVVVVVDSFHQVHHGQVRSAERPL